jgi:hypothetical protein
VIKAVLLKPVDRETLRTIQPVAAVLEASMAEHQPEAEAHLVAWSQFSLALMAFREGQMDLAGDWASRSLSTATNSPARTVSNRIVLAMVDMKQNRVSEARDALVDSRREVERWAAEPFSILASDGFLWSNWGIARILLHDAERLSAGTED